MSLEVIKDQIRSFLKSRASEVLAIRGDWGVGKTFTWDQVLNECQQEKMKGNFDAIGLNYYSYVSLFGVTTLQDLRTEIVFNKLNTLDLKHAEGVTKIQKNAGKFLPGIITHALKYTGINTGTLVDTLFSSMSNSMIRNTIICIDDFERSTIGEKEALGFINDLAKSRGCKIALLLNDRITKEYKTYREKVIDYDVEFKIDPIETIDIITKKSDDELIETVRDQCIKIGVTNLRIIKKILNLLAQAREQHKLDAYIPDVQHQFIRTLTLAAYCFYGHDEKAPTVDYLLNEEEQSSTRVLMLMAGRLDESELSEDERKKNDIYKTWDNFLNLYEHRAIDDFDKLIINSVISGFIDKEQFQELAKRWQNIYLDHTGSHEIDSSIDYFYTTLMTEEQEDIFSKQLTNCMIENIENANQRTINESYKILSRLGRTNDRDRILDKYMKTHSGKPQYFSTKVGDRKINWDTKLKEQFEETFKSIMKIRPAKETFKDLLKIDRIPSTKDIESLSYMTEDDINDLIRDKSSDGLRATIQYLLYIQNHGSSLEHIHKKAIKVLQNIAKESEQKKMLVEHYGISIDRPE